VKTVLADFLPTAKNGLAKDFLVNQGFIPMSDGRFAWDLSRQTPQPESTFPIAVTIEV
jgi:hypothetical protein